MKNATLTLLSGGDVAPWGHYKALIAEPDGDVLGAARAEIATADLAVVNLGVHLCTGRKEVTKSAPAIQRAKVDVLIVCVHGGNEYFPRSRPRLGRICHFLTEMGADAVIGHHPHVPGPYEFRNGKPIFYILGNLSLDTSQPPMGWDLGYLVRPEIRFDTADQAQIAPTLILYVRPEYFMIEDILSEVVPNPLRSDS